MGITAVQGSTPTTPDALADAFLQEMGADVQEVSRQNITFCGIPAVELVAESAVMRWKAVFTTVGTRNFEVVALSFKSDWDTYNGIFDKIFESFSITR